MNWMLKAAAFIGFVGFFSFIFFKVGDLWLNASKDALDDDAAIGRQIEEAGPQANSNDAQSAAGAEQPPARAPAPGRSSRPVRPAPRL